MAKIRINGDTSGYIEISAPAVAGSTSITLPATTGGSLLATDASGNLNVDSGLLYVDGVNNRVGIGTASPSSTLHVVGNQYLTAGNYFTDGTSGYFFNGAGGFAGGIYGSSSGNIANIVSPQTILFGTASSERARIDSSGRLGIGTSTPSALLHVAGTIGVGTSAAVIRRNEVQGSTGLRLQGNANDTVSDTNPGAYINIGGGPLTDTFEGSINLVAYGNTAAGERNLITFSNRSGTNTIAERARITSAGYLKVSSTGSYRNASGLYNEIRQGAGNDNVLWLDHTATSGGLGGLSINYLGQAPNNTGNLFIYCSDTSATRFELRSNGGIANFSGNNVNLSDFNSKKDISPAVGTWDCIKQWEIVNYRYKDQPDDADLNLGVIAQQVAESCPEVVTVFEEAKEDTPEKLGVKEQQMYWMAIKALQEAQLRIEQLETTNASFEARLSALEVKP